MKRISICLFALLMLIAPPLYAQNLNILSSRQELTAYALRQSKFVSASIGSFLPTGPGADAFVSVESSTAKGIVDTIKHMSLSLTAINPNDKMFSYASVTNQDQEQLFSGYHEFYLQLSAGQYLLPADFGDIQLELAAEIPIDMSGIFSAQVNPLNAQGQTTGAYPLRVSNGKLYFPSELVGDDAILAIGTYSEMTGTVWSYWTVKDGKKVTPTNLGIPLEPKISGVASLANADIDVQIPTVNNHGENLMVEYLVSGDQNLKVRFSTTEGRVAIGVSVRRTDDATWTKYSLELYPNSQITLPVTSGVYYLIPIWREGDLITQPNQTWVPFETPGM